jgi:hypothetical protein
MSENFQKLEKAMKQKMTKLINERLKYQSTRSRSDETIETSKSKSTSKLISREKLETSKEISVAKKSQSSEKSRANVETDSTTMSFT